MNKYRLVVSMIALMLSAMVCDPTAKVSTIEPNCSSIAFHLYPEVSTNWVAQVQPNTTYLISVSSEDPAKHPNRWIQIAATDENDNLLGNMPTYTTEAAVLSLASPQNAGKINIEISSVLGEGNEDLGLFNITLCKKQ